MVALSKQGVRFVNTHSMFPTFTTANASAMATGHKLGDTGDFSNTIDAGFDVPGAGDSLTSFLESDPVLGDVDEHYAGDYLNQETVMKAARLAGYSTATIGKLGPALIFDHAERSGEQTIVIDDITGRPGGIALSKGLQARLVSADLGAQAPTRGDNGSAGDVAKPGTLQDQCRAAGLAATVKWARRRGMLHPRPPYDPDFFLHLTPQILRTMTVQRRWSSPIQPP